MDSDYWDLIRYLIGTVAIIVGVFAILLIPTVDYSDMEAQVKVQEVGTRYAFFNFGEQNYIRVQNAYSEQYSASSESWETCIDYRDLEKFTRIKNNRTIVNVKVKGYGFSTVFNCITGDRVVEILNP